MQTPENENVGPDTIRAQGPEEFTGGRLEAPRTKAAGLEAVAVAVRHVVGEVGPVRGFQVLNDLNKFGGVDCPGCAWPDPDDHRSALGEYCENGAKAIAEEATTRTIGADFFRENGVAGLSRKSDYELGKSGRLIEPLILREGESHYSPISWTDAFDEIADYLKNQTTPERSVFYTSGRTSNEAAFLYQLMVRQFGTNNMPDCSNMCHESSGVALKQTLGLGKGSVTLDDFEKAELILVVGQNPGTNHPRMLTALQKAKRAGARIISVNPLPEAGLMAFSNPQQVGGILGGATPLSDLHLPVRINGDVPLFKAILTILLRKEEDDPGRTLDHDFMDAYTEGFDDLQAHLLEQDLDRLIEASGVGASLVHQAAEWLAGTQRFITCWAMGLTQHRNAVDNIREIVNLHLFKGAIGIPGAGTCPVRGHSNVQGDRTMGIWERPTPQFLDGLRKCFEFEPPREPGMNTVEAIQGMVDGKVDFFMAMGGNFLSAAPDTELTAKGLQKCGMTVHVSTKLNRTHLHHGKVSLILPCLGRTDRDDHGGKELWLTVENSMGVVHKTQGKLKPVSEQLRSEPSIICGIAKRLFSSDQPVDWASADGNYDQVRQWIEKSIAGFEGFRGKVENPSGFYLPNGPRHRRFTTQTGKAQFTLNKWRKWELLEGEYLMMTIRSHDQFNTTIYGLHDRYRGIYFERRVVFMNHEDARKRGFDRGTVVDLETVSGKGDIQRCVRQFKVVPYDIPTGCIATYFPECNALIPLDAIAHGSHTPASKSIVVRIRAGKDVERG